jgi:hypothetical protein
MKPCRPRQFVLLLAVLVSTLVTLPPAVAAPPPGWVDVDIGHVGALGFTDVTNFTSNGIWGIAGSGFGVFSNEDSFHYVFRLVRGNASIAARFLLAEPEGDGDFDRQAGFGLMIRENDSPGSPNLFYAMTPEQGLLATLRREQNRETEDSRQPAYGNPNRLDVGGADRTREVGPSGTPQFGLHMRLQRVGNEITGYYSRDGILWSQAAFPPQTLDTLQEEARFGLTVTSRRYGELARGLFDQVRVLATAEAPDAGALAVSDLVGLGGDGSVELRWRALPGALGYDVYRESAPGRFSRLNNTPVLDSFYLDRSQTNGAPISYAVAARLPGPGGGPRQGPAVAVRAMPIAVPTGWAGCMVGAPPIFQASPPGPAGPLEGSAGFDRNTNRFTVSGSGGGIVGGRASELYFLNQRVNGDVQLVATLREQAPGIAGLMIRESIESIGRHACIYTSKSRPDATALPVFFSSQTSVTDAIVTLPATSTLPGDGVTLPVRLRLTRRGNTIEFHYATGGGAAWVRAAPPVTFEGLQPTLYVGMVAASGSRRSLSAAQFDMPEINRNPPATE